MTNKEITFSYQEFDNITDLPTQEQVLLETAKEFTKNAYAPYSNFFVAATALLSNGQMVSATNQENASYPIGICAERSLLATIAAMFPNQKIETMAISFYNHNKNVNNIPASPCGMCRQAMLEWEQRQQQHYSIILGAHTGKIWKINSAISLLPLSFVSDFLQ